MKAQIFVLKMILFWNKKFICKDIEYLKDMNMKIH